MVGDPVEANRAGNLALPRRGDGAVLVTGLASALSGVGFSQQAPKGAVPMRSGRTPSPEASKRAAALKKAVNTLSALNLASELVLVAMDSATDGRT